VQVVVPAAGTTAKIDAYPLRPTSRFAVRARAGQNTKEMVLRIGGLEIAEVFADAVGIDDQLQWVKLHNTTSIPIDLNNYRLKSGVANYDLTGMGLSGTVAAGGCVVIGGPVQSSLNSEPLFSQAVDINPNLPGGGAQAAGFAVFDNNPVPVNGVVTPVDTMLVGAGNTAKLLGPDAEIATPFCGVPAEGMSALRVGPSKCVTALPQPRTCP